MRFAKSNIIPLFFSAVTVLMMLASCGSKKGPLDAYGPILKNVMHSEVGAFRGNNLGDKQDSVKLRENVPPTESDDGYLYYEYLLDNGDSYNVTYAFDDGGLNEISSNVFVADVTKTDSVLDSFKTYFEDHYGASETDKGYDVWSVRSEKLGNIQIDLRDESPSFKNGNAPGKISISIYPDKD